MGVGRATVGPIRELLGSIVDRKGQPRLVQVIHDPEADLVAADAWPLQSGRHEIRLLEVVRMDSLAVRQSHFCAATARHLMNPMRDVVQDVGRYGDAARCTGASRLRAVPDVGADAQPDEREASDEADLLDARAPTPEVAYWLPDVRHVARIIGATMGRSSACSTPKPTLLERVQAFALEAFEQIGSSRTWTSGNACLYRVQGGRCGQTRGPPLFPRSAFGGVTRSRSGGYVPADPTESEGRDREHRKHGRRPSTDRISRQQAREREARAPHRHSCTKASSSAGDPARGPARADAAAAAERVLARFAVSRVVAAVWLVRVLGLPVSPGS